MASLHELVRQAEIGLFIVQYLGFYSAPILCNCARDVISSSRAKVAKQERQNAFEIVLGQGRVRGLCCAGEIASEGMLFLRACHQIADFIMRSWSYLADGPALYPGLSEPSNHICVWRDNPTCVSPLLDKMLLTAGAADINTWESWQKSVDSVDPTWWHSPKTFVDAWRGLNPDTSAVTRIANLLEEGTYEVRIYGYDAKCDRQPILALSWIMFGVRGVFSVEDSWFAL